jgi:uncharacterized protein (TIGR02266 family)
MNREMAEARVVVGRQHDAVEQAVELSFDDFRAFLKSSSANFSPDGIFVETDEPAPPGTTVALELSLSDGHSLISGRGAVEWTRSSGDGEETPGMGIRFLDLDAASERLISRIVEERTKAGLELFDLDRESSETPKVTPREFGADERPVRMIPAAATDDQQAEMDELRREHAEERSQWQAELEAAHQATTDLNTRLRDSLSRMMATKDARDALAEELRSLQEASQQDRQRVEELDAERARLQSELEEHKAESNRRTEEVVAATTERESLEEKLAAARNKIEELASEIGELRSSSTEKIAEAEAELVTAKSAKEEAEGKLQETEAALEELKKEAADAESSLRQSLDETQSEIEKGNRKNEALACKAKALEEEVDQIRTELVEAQERAEELESEAERTRDAMAGLQSRHDEMEAEAAIQHAAAARAEKLIQRVGAEHAALQDHLAEAQAALEEIGVSRQSLKTQPEKDREEISTTADMDESSDDEEPAPPSTVKGRLADFAARLRSGKDEETDSDSSSLDEPDEDRDEQAAADAP